MGPVHYESNHDGTGEQKALGRIQIKDGIVQNLDARRFLYQTRDKIDNKEVYD
jgi:hypothetical protein